MRRLVFTVLLGLILPLQARADSEAFWAARIEAATGQAAEQTGDWQARIDKANHAAEAAMARGAGTAARVDVDRIPQPKASQPATDINQVVERFQGYLDSQARANAAPGGLSIFVSLAMPRPSLERLVAQAEKSGATLVLRGMLQGSIAKTTAAVIGLIGQRKVAWTIDPDAFKRFDVKWVPVYVLTRAGAVPVGCHDGLALPEDSYVRLAGDVSIEYALDAIDRLQPGFHAEVERARGKP
jgi:conjugal transfer pilus assembly protein TrbC